MTTSQAPVFLINSRLGRFSAARFGSPCKRVHLPRAPLLPKLRGHFAEFLDQDSLERLRLLASPTCVGLRYGRAQLSRAKLFSAARLRSLDGGRSPLRHQISANRADLPTQQRLPPYIGQARARRTFHHCVPPHVQTNCSRYGNIDPFPIGYAFRPRLRGRLTLS